MGVTASWAMLGDILIAENQSNYRFCWKTCNTRYCKRNFARGIQTAEYVKDHGGIDLVVERKYLNYNWNFIKCIVEKREAQAKNESI